MTHRQPAAPAVSSCILPYMLQSALYGVLMLGLCNVQWAQAAPIDEFRLSGIEQNIRDLQTAVREQARTIADLQQQLLGGSRKSGVSPAISTGVSQLPTEQRWLSLANWQKIKPGMNELQVIEILGTPTQVRLDAAQTRSLLYAMEIGRSGFLTGRVVMTAGQSTAVEIPTLK